MNSDESNSMPTPQEILAELKNVKYPGFSRDIVSFGLVKDIQVGYAGVTVYLSAPSADPEVTRTIAREVEERVTALVRPGAVRIEIEARPDPAQQARQAIQAQRRKPQGTRFVVAVASGKGGVGKSTVAVNLALALSALGWRVGLMDADVYGPSVALMLGGKQPVTLTPERRIVPLERYGIRYVSMALFIDDEMPVIWRGPMITKLENEFLFNVEWGELDCLVLDLPPGTGDAQLTITQRVALDGGVIVTTPQEIALLDVRRGVTMFQEVSTPVLGVVENMSYHLCRKCGRRHQVFGHGGGSRMAQEMDLALLGEMPLVPELRDGGDRGRPLVMTNPNHPASQVFKEIARKVRAQLEARSAE